MFPEHRSTNKLEKLLQNPELFEVDVKYNPVRDVLLELAKKVESIPLSLQNIPPPIVPNNNEQEIKELTHQFNKLKQNNKEQYSEFNGEIRELKQYFNYQLKDIRDKYDKKLLSISNSEPALSKSQPTELIQVDDKYENLANQLENLTLRFERFVNSVNGITASPVHYRRPTPDKPRKESDEPDTNEDLKLDLSKVTNETHQLNDEPSIIITEKANSQPSTPKIPHYIQKEIFKDPRIDDLFLQMKLMNTEIKSQNDKIKKVSEISNNMITTVSVYRQEMEMRNEEFDRIYDRMAEMNLSIDKRLSSVNSEFDNKLQVSLTEQNQLKTKLQMLENEKQNKMNDDDIGQKVDLIKSDIFEQMTLIDTNSRSQFQYVELEIEEMKKQLIGFGVYIKEIPKPAIVEQKNEPIIERSEHIEQLITSNQDSDNKTQLEITLQQDFQSPENQPQTLQDQSQSPQKQPQSPNDCQRPSMVINQRDSQIKNRQYSINEIIFNTTPQSPKIEKQEKQEIEKKIELIHMKPIELDPIIDHSSPKLTASIQTEKYDIPIERFNVSIPNGSVPNAISTFNVCDIEHQHQDPKLTITPLCSFVQSKTQPHLDVQMSTIIEIKSNEQEEPHNSSAEVQEKDKEMPFENQRNPVREVIQDPKAEDIHQPNISPKSRDFSFERMLCITISNNDSSTKVLLESIQEQINGAIKLAPLDQPLISKEPEVNNQTEKVKPVIERVQHPDESKTFFAIMKPIINAQQNQISLLENRIKQLESSQNDSNIKPNPQLQLLPLSPGMLKRKPMVLSPNQTVKKNVQKKSTPKESEKLPIQIRTEVQPNEERDIELDHQNLLNKDSKIQNSNEEIAVETPSETEFISFNEDIQKSVNLDIIDKLDNDIKQTKMEIAAKFTESDLIEFRDRLIELERQLGFLSKQVSALSTPIPTQPTSSRALNSAGTITLIEKECQHFDIIDNKPETPNQSSRIANETDVDSISEAETSLNNDEIEYNISEQSIYDNIIHPERKTETPNEITAINSEQFIQYKSYCDNQFKGIKNEIAKLVNEIHKSDSSDILLDMDNSDENTSTLLKSEEKVEIKHAKGDESKAGKVKKRKDKKQSLDNQITELRSEMYNLVQKLQQRSNKLTLEMEQRLTMQLQQINQAKQNNRKSHNVKTTEHSNEIVVKSKEGDDIPIDSFHIDSFDLNHIEEEKNQTINQKRANDCENKFINCENQLNKDPQIQIGKIELNSSDFHQVKLESDTKIPDNEKEQQLKKCNDPIQYVTESPRYSDFLKEFYERPVPQALREVTVTNIEPAKIVFQTMVLPYLIDVRKELQAKVDKALELSRLAHEIVRNKVDKEFVNDFFGKIRIKINELRTMIDEVKNSNMCKVTQEELQNVTAELYKSISKEQTTMIGATSYKCLLCGALKHGVNGMITDKNVADALGDPQQARATNYSTMICGSDKQCYRGRGNYGRTGKATKLEPMKNRPT